MAQYAPDVYEVIHPQRERIGSVTRCDARRWEAVDVFGVHVATFTTRTAAGVALASRRAGWPEPELIRSAQDVARDMTRVGA